MSLGHIDFADAKRRLREFDDLLAQLDFARAEFHERLENYRELPNPREQAALLSSIAFFDRFVQPIIARRTTRPRQRIEPSERLVLAIDREWRTYEFNHLFSGVDYLNKLYVIREKLRSDAPELRLRREITRSYVYRRSLLYYYLAPREELQVDAIHFASPGSITLEGLATAVAEIRETLHYVFTFQFVKGFLDLYDHIKYERPAQRAAHRMRLQEVLRRERNHERTAALQDLEEYRRFLSKLSEIADLASSLESKGLANAQVVEDTVMRQLNLLHRLGFEQEKVQIAAPAGEAEGITRP